MNRYFTLLIPMLLLSHAAGAQVINANPSNYTTFLSTLLPGDTLLLSAGNYTDRLNINNMSGSPGQPIVIMGSGNSTVFLGDACCNTVSITMSSYITIRDFTIDGQNLAVDGVKAEGTAGNWAHNIVLENLEIIRHGANQQIVGINTKCPTWDWTIRKCTIDSAGTGIYLGNSNGEDPFVNGIIENNLITNTVGYNMEIKHQNVGSRNVSGMTLDGKTIIRNNVFSKENNASSGSSARPNLLVGNFPATGDGVNDYYEIYGNFFWQNPTESLFQGTGNIGFYDNVCVNYAGGNGLAFQNHNSFEPRDIRIFHNTVVCDVNWGIRLMDTDVAYQKYVYGNAVFSDHSTPIRVVGGGIATANLSDNVEDVIANANNYVNDAANNINTLDLYPSTGSALNGTLIPNTLFTGYADYSIDFNVTNRTWFYRGAYSGEGTNPGWQLALEKKPPADTTMTGINDHASGANLPEVKLYPNPTSGQLSIDLGTNSELTKVQIHTIAGRLVQSKSYANSQILNLELNEPAGVYLIVIESGKQLVTLRLIKQD